MGAISWRRPTASSRHAPPHGGVVWHDHRLAMAFAIAALGASGPTTVHDAGAAAVSYPEFFTVLDSLRA